MGGSRERSQGSPAASMGRLSLVSIFAAPLRNLEEMRLCMLKRAASLRGNSRDVSTGGNTSPSSERRGSGRGKRHEEREQRQGACGRNSAGAPALAANSRALQLAAPTNVTRGGNTDLAEEASPPRGAERGSSNNREHWCYLAIAAGKAPAWWTHTFGSLLVADPTGASENGFSSQQWSLLCSAQQRMRHKSPKRQMEEFCSIAEKKKNPRKEHLPPISQTAGNKRRFTFLLNSRRTLKRFLP